MSIKTESHVSSTNNNCLCNDCWWGCIEYLCCVQIYKQYFLNPEGMGDFIGLCDKCTVKVKGDKEKMNLKVRDVPTIQTSGIEYILHTMYIYEDCTIWRAVAYDDVHLGISFEKLIMTPLYEKMNLLINVLWKSLPPCIATECAWNYLNNSGWWRFGDENPKAKPHECSDVFLEFDKNKTK